MSQEPPAPTAELTAAAEPDVVVPPCDRPGVSVVIVTHGADRDLMDTIRSLVRETPAGELELIVVDNPRADGRSSARLLRDVTAGIRLIVNDRNVGFGPANDTGVRLARAPLVCLCNPDIVVPEGWLGPLVRALDDPAVGISAPVLVNADGSLQEAGQLLLDDGNTVAVGGPELFSGDWAQVFTRDVDYASAAFWLLRRDEYLGFNPKLVPAYFEDVDYALRLEQRGQVVRLVVDRPVTHVHRSSLSSAASTIAERSRDIFRAEWAERLRQQHPRPATGLDALLARDRQCAHRLAVVATRSRRVEGAAAAAMRLAVARPRARVALIAGQVAIPRARTLRATGVEVVEGDPGELVAARSPWATAVIGGFGRLGRTTRAALAGSGVDARRIAQIDW
jgi:GT2 family glycosyltransferase